MDTSKSSNYFPKSGLDLASDAGLVCGVETLMEIGHFTIKVSTPTTMTEQCFFRIDHAYRGTHIS